jgi:putative SOS response-associated peptidase YedK
VSGGRKRPFFIQRRDGAMFGLAALAENWIGPNGEEIETVAIVTAAASADLAVLHHRAPVTLMADDFAHWLDCSSDDAAPVMALLKGPQPGEFTWHQVSTRVNHADNDDAQLLLPITDEQRAIEDAPRRVKAAPRKTAPPSVDDGQGSLF